MHIRTALPAVLAVLTLYSGARGHAQDAGVPDLVSRANRYVEEYERQLSAVVCEERQTQRLVKSDGLTRQSRELVSDLLVLRTAHRTAYRIYTQTFRDVIAVDGKPVHNRQERLRTLFLGKPREPLKQAHAISAESARHNMGFSRDADILLPLAILSADNATGFHFASTADGLTFEEFRSPSLEWSRTNRPLIPGLVFVNGPRRDLFLRGALTIDGNTGRLSSAQLTADNGDFAVSVDIRYAEDAASGLLMPVESREEYRSPKSKDRTEVSSTYSNFRRFQVTVDDRVSAPPSDR